MFLSKVGPPKENSYTGYSANPFAAAQQRAAEAAAAKVFAATGQVISGKELLAAKSGGASSAAAAAALPILQAQGAQPSPVAPSSKAPFVQQKRTFAQTAPKKTAEESLGAMSDGSSAAAARPVRPKPKSAKPLVRFAYQKMMGKKDSDTSDSDVSDSDEEVVLRGKLHRRTLPAPSVAQEEEFYILDKKGIYQIAARDGDVAALQSKEADAVVPECIVRHAFILAARHGRKEVIDHFSKVYEIPEDYFADAIAEAICRKVQDDLDDLERKEEEVYQEAQACRVEGRENIQGCLDDQESFEMIKYLISSCPMSESNLLAIGAHIGAFGRSDIFRLLCQDERISINSHIRDEILEHAIEGRLKSVRPEHVEDLVADCLSLSISSDEDRLWALQYAASLSNRPRDLAILQKVIKSGEFSLEERTNYSAECLELECGFLLFTTNLPDNSDTRAWALRSAISFPSEGDNSPLVRELFAYYRELDKDKPISSNYGLSDAQVAELLYAVPSYDEAIEEIFEEEFKVTDEIRQKVEEAAELDRLMRELSMREGPKGQLVFIPAPAREAAAAAAGAAATTEGSGSLSDIDD